jgi:acetamidase/formamidase
MDFNEVREGATLYLPVSHTGAYLYFADGHALMADGEPTGAGVETSMDVQFTVSLKKGAKLTDPRLENKDYIFAIASQAEFVSSLDRSLRQASSGMLRWLQEDYHLDAVTAHMLIGYQGQYEVITVGGSMALKLAKSVIPKR